MKTKYKILFSCLIFLGIFGMVPCFLYAQMSDNFSDGNISENPVWSGNTDHFMVNSNFQLQLNAQAAGESFIYTPYTLPKDSLEIELYFRMTFDPSDNNLSFVYLAIDNVNPSVANGYYLRLGENGTADNIKIYKLESGASTLIGSCAMGAISRDPAQARVKIRITKNGMWFVETDYAGSSLTTPDIEFIDPGIFSLASEVYYGIYCKYTSTRLRNFFYDDISIKKWERDSIPPQVVSFQVLTNKSVEIVFSERLDISSSTETNNYVADQGLSSPESVTIGQNENRVVLTFSSEIESGKEYTLQLKNIADVNGNVLTTTIPFFRAVSPGKKDIIINEVLTDPFVGGEDFVEVLNISTKFIQLKDVIIRNASKNEEKAITRDFILKPGEYVAISKNTEFLQSQYNTPSEARFLANDLPSLNVADAHVQIVINQGGVKTVIDSFEYVKEFHFSLLNNTKGVSLERILPEGPSNDKNNWHSASQSSGFATPGYQNSNFKREYEKAEEEISIVNKIFSPYAKDLDAFLLIQYNLEKSGYLATIRIYDVEGFLVRKLSNNLLLGLDGVLKWDGFTDEQIPAKMGWYVIATRLFHPDGESKEFRHTVVVGDQW